MWVPKDEDGKCLLCVLVSGEEMLTAEGNTVDTRYDNIYTDMYTTSRLYIRRIRKDEGTIGVEERKEGGKN